MINYYYNDKVGLDTLIVDLDKEWFIAVSNYFKLIADKPEDYNYKDAEYILFKRTYSGDGVLLNDNKIFLESLKHDGQNLRRNIIKTLFLNELNSQG